MPVEFKSLTRYVVTGIGHGGDDGNRMSACPAPSQPAGAIGGGVIMKIGGDTAGLG